MMRIAKVTKEGKEGMETGYEVTKEIGTNWDFTVCSLTEEEAKQLKVALNLRTDI